jgi:lysophospholipase L1-like esterase
MNQVVQLLYEHGDTGQLIAAAQGAGIVTDDCAGARQALRLLARLGDPDAVTFCAAAPDACLPAATTN